MAIAFSILNGCGFGSDNCIYLIECRKNKCNMKYVGETKRIVKFRFAEHRGYVNNHDETPTGEHFN